MFEVNPFWQITIFRLLKEVSMNFRTRFPSQLGEIGQLLVRSMVAVALAGGKVALVICLGSVVLFGQTVSLTNTTRGGSSVFYVGDA